MKYLKSSSIRLLDSNITLLINIAIIKLTKGRPMRLLELELIFSKDEKGL